MLLVTLSLPPPPPSSHPQPHARAVLLPNALALALAQNQRTHTTHTHGTKPAPNAHTHQNNQRTLSFRHKTITMSKAVIGKPAPAFTAQAIVNGEIKEISLSDYKGAFQLAMWACGVSRGCAREKRKKRLSSSSRRSSSSSLPPPATPQGRVIRAREARGRCRPVEFDPAACSGRARAPRGGVSDAAAGTRRRRSRSAVGPRPHPPVTRARAHAALSSSHHTPNPPTTQASTSSSSFTPWTGRSSGESKILRASLVEKASRRTRQEGV